ncbi:HAD-IB family hydrolase [Paractinoplanes atraurantiacus]|uniref:Putative phosphoserine phosphatase / 1-acylglycerol-3-phosphate O-acyltransferase n=1 Tax=Paractinoplanes atraurantiacus TaxID=1036182 RepID=A0A285JJ49_9ACTN|nr:HAD-IB family hydrolase [Actinoplanes atraurantiacus]SNY59406.1 putative phosphoserine phosphatase / 1-acylglycerol-3-phosphate O-acyltransferase [Actinoplanes atraurantiacus]
MSHTLSEVTDVVRTGDAGPRVGAFFDLDGTLVHGYTADSIYRDRIRRGDIGAREFARIIVAAVDGTLLGGDPPALGAIGFAALRGRTVGAVTETGERLFAERIAGTMRPEARDLVRAHLRRGHTVVVASSATRMQIAPVARDLGIAHIVCTELEEEDGVLTGRSTAGMLWGEPKAKAVRAFALAHDIDLERSYAYANGPEDIAFLSSVGHPYALNPHPDLCRAAGELGWPVLTLREPRTPDLRAFLGTVGGLIGVNAGLATGVTIGWLTGDRRLGLNAGVGLAADLALALTGVRLNVVGEENLDRARPAVFIANHQSTLDVPVLAALLRHDFTAVAKQEARLDPRMAVIGAVLDPVWIDRSDLAKAKQSLDGVAERLRAGVSILILPEGTRMPTPTLGRFKKGAFHIARQAGVPIVPIVLRNTGELAWRRSLLVNPGTVDVAVLDPIPTDGWTADDLDDRIAEVRQQVAATLEDWPA